MKLKLLFPLTITCMLLSTAACFSGGSNFPSEKSGENTQKSSEQSSNISTNQSFNPPSSASSEPIKISQSYVPESYVLSKDDKTCENHILVDEVVRTATIIQKGVIRHICYNCGGYNDEFTYDLEEFDFTSKTFMYDGKERELLIEGLIPYGCTVKYENNKLTEVGQKEATATIYDEENNVIATKKATISIVQNNGLPSVKITTSTGKDPNYHDKTNYTTMTLSTENCDSKYVLSNIAGGIRARGNSTNYDGISKHPWRIKFDKKQNMLGLHNGEKFKSWVFLAEYFDQSLLRNSTAFCLGNSLLNYSENYASRYQHVNFYMNGDFRGVYLLAEQQQANKNRIDLNEPEEGAANEKEEKVGYLVEIDQRGDDDDPYFNVEPEVKESIAPKAFPGWPGGGGWPGGNTKTIDVNGVAVAGHKFAIKTDTFDTKQKDYVGAYFQSAYSSLINIAKYERLQTIDENNNLVDSPYDNQYDTVNSYIDLDSAFKMCILHELMKNYDVGFGSFYMFIDFSNGAKYGRITFGAPWDFDLSGGNKTYGDNSKSEGEYIKAAFGSDANDNWWLFLLSQCNFYDYMFKRYYSVFVNSGAFENVIDNIDYITSAFSTDLEKDATKWYRASGRDRMQTRQYSNQKSASDYFRDWLCKRKTYMDNTYLK